MTASRASSSETDTVLQQIAEQIINANDTGRALRIIGGNSKAFYGRDIDAAPLHMGEYRGVVAYEPSELVITVRAGTPLAEVEALLESERQMFAFEPPHFSDTATIGGTLAAGLSGPGRPYYGAVRDMILGVSIMNSMGRTLTFGGQVMKNVAGYDVSRLMAGALGTLGVLLDLSIRVAPRPECESTFAWQCDTEVAQAKVLELSQLPWPLTAAAYDGDVLRLRMSGHEDAVEAAARSLAPSLREGTNYWDSLKNHRLEFFHNDQPCWRLSVPPASEPCDLRGEWLYDWGGACRWLISDETEKRVRDAAAALGGHATLFRNGSTDTPFTPLDPVSTKIHQRLKQQFDPNGIFNPGRMYRDF